ncbi:MAG: glycosyltransferase [Cyanobacteria bacterium J06638_20]
MPQSQAPSRPSPLNTTLNYLFYTLLSVCGLVGLFVLQNPGHLSFLESFSLLGLGALGIWRWSWFFYRFLRSRFYVWFIFPRWRKRANAVPVEALPHMCFLVPTYKEKLWITRRVFQAIAYEATTLAQPITVLANSSSDEENNAIRAILEEADPGLQTMRLILMTQKDGKRKAMADALRELARLGLPKDSVIALMDGDSELLPGTLRKCLPFFWLFPKMGALTTDEIPIVQGSYLFSEWFHLRFAQRHIQMCSDAVSHKVMCLTGRFSLFRAEAALDPSFAHQLEHDSLHDWLWGRFKFLSGDDKSTWFWLLSRGYDMLYVPDSIVYSIETISGSVAKRAYNNMRRWFGNMLRNSSRAIALGPRVAGWFTWYSLIDQRISFWTCLVTPGFLILSLLQGRWLAASLVICWITFSRSLMLGLVFWGRQSILKPIHFPMLILSQWSSSLVKIWTQMNLAQQSWTNRGNQSIDAAGTGFRRFVKRSMSDLLLWAQGFCFVIFLLWLAGFLRPAWDIAGLRLSHQAATNQVVVEHIDVIEHGIWPNDDRDDAAPLMALIHRYPSDAYLDVQLPIGQLDLFHSLEIDRSHITLSGQGIGRTVLNVHFEADTSAALAVSLPEVAENAAVVVVAPQQSNLASLPGAGSNAIASDLSSELLPDSAAAKLQDVHLQDFTIRYGEAITDRGTGAIATAIIMQRVEDGSLSRIRIEPEHDHPLILDQTQDIRVEHTTLPKLTQVSSQRAH